MQQALFVSGGAQAVLRFLVGIKNVGQYKKLPCDKFMKEKITFHKVFSSMQNFLELQCLIDDLVDFLELSMFINASLPLLIKFFFNCYLAAPWPLLGHSQGDSFTNLILITAFYLC